jgi:sigma-B regulation protein RsbU (phosphoserine phosphatase)
MLRNGSWTEVELELEVGDRLALYSDGVIEAMSGNGEMFGEGRLLEALGAHRESALQACCNGIMGRLESWSASNRLQDDCSLLMVGVV